MELAAVSDPDAVPDAVAAVFGVTQQPGASLAESIAEAMEGKTQLLVFDNCEHLRDAAAELIDTILARSTTVRILATSREGLTSPTSTCGLSHRWTSMPESALRQWISSSIAPGLWSQTSS